MTWFLIIPDFCLLFSKKSNSSKMNNLVSYSSSEDEEGTVVVPEVTKQPVAPSTSRKTKLPMLLKVETKKSRINDQPEEHQNRVRSIPHIEGNWASHVFIECKLKTFLNAFISTFYHFRSIEWQHKRRDIAAHGNIRRITQDWVTAPFTQQNFHSSPSLDRQLF